MKEIPINTKEYIEEEINRSLDFWINQLKIEENEKENRKSQRRFYIFIGAAYSSLIWMGILFILLHHFGIV